MKIFEREKEAAAVFLEGKERDKKEKCFLNNATRFKFCLHFSFNLSEVNGKKYLKISKQRKTCLQRRRDHAFCGVSSAS